MKKQPSIEFLASHGIIVSRREVRTVPNEIITSRGVVVEGTVEVTRDYFSPSMSKDYDTRCKIYWFYNPVGMSLNDEEWGENPGNPFDKEEEE